MLITPTTLDPIYDYLCFGFRAKHRFLNLRFTLFGPFERLSEQAKPPHVPFAALN